MPRQRSRSPSAQIDFTLGLQGVGSFKRPRGGATKKDQILIIEPKMGNVVTAAAESSESTKSLDLSKVLFTPSSTQASRNQSRNSSSNFATSFTLPQSTAAPKPVLNSLSTSFSVLPKKPPQPSTHTNPSFQISPANPIQNSSFATSTQTASTSTQSKVAIVPFQDQSITEENSRLTKRASNLRGFSVNQDISSDLEVRAEDLEEETGSQNELTKELWEMLEGPDDAIEAREEDSTRAALARVLRGIEEEEGSEWTQPVGEEPVDRHHLVFPDLNKSGAGKSGDILVAGSSRSTTYFSSYEPNAEIRLSHTYASSLLSTNRLLYLFPFSDDAHPFTLESRFQSGRTVTNSIQERLLQTYANLVLRWLEWCDKEKISPKNRLPATPELVIRWVSSLGGRYSSSYIRKHLNAISFWHHLQFLKFDVDPSLRRQILAGCKTLQPNPKTDRRGITVHDILAVFEELKKEDQEKPCQKNRNVAIRACMLVLFWGMGRVKDGTVDRQAEFKPQSKEEKRLRAAEVKAGLTPTATQKRRTFDTRYDASGANFQFYKSTHKHPPLVSLFLPHDKSKHKDGIKLQLPQQTAINGALDPVEACRVHMILNKPDGSTPAFAYFGNKGQRRNLTKKEFMDRINEALDKTSRPPIHGHSFRIGGNNVFRLAGINPEFVKPAGRWQASSSYQIYGRDPEKVSRAQLSNVVVDEEQEDILEEEQVETEESDSEDEEE